MLTISAFARDPEQAIAALDALGDACYPEESISVLRVQPRQRRRHAPRPSGSLGIGEPLGWFPGLDLLTVPGIGPIIASGPALALLQAHAGGGLSGLLRRLGFRAPRARLLSRRLSYGDLLLAVPVRHAAEAAEVRDIFRDRGLEEIAQTVLSAPPAESSAPLPALIPSPAPWKGPPMRSAIVVAACAALLLPAAEGTAPPLHEGPAPAAAAADTALAQRVRQALQEDASLSTAARSVSVSAQHGGITLSGRIAAADHRPLRERVAGVVGVRAVKDELVIHPTPAPSASDSVPGAEPRKGREILPGDPAEADAELEERVRQALIDDRQSRVTRDPPADPTGVAVRGGVVWIEGALWRTEDRARLIPMLAALPGVSRVAEGAPPAAAEATARFDPERTDDRPQADAPPHP